MEVRDDAPEQATGDFWYDFFAGGYINPGDFLKNEEDVDKVMKASEILEEFREALYDSEKITDM